MQCRTLMLAICGALTLAPASLLAADLPLAPAGPEAVVTAPAACLRWEWRQYSWYDDCWAQRHPYIGGISPYRVYARRVAVEK
jgi:hypothetical protein